MQNNFPNQRPFAHGNVQSEEVNVRPAGKPTSTHHSFSIMGRQHAEHATAEVDEKSSKFFGFLDGVITTCMALFFFGIPLFFTGLTFQGIAFEKQIFFYGVLLIALVAWTTKGVISGEMKIRRTPLDIPILIFVVTYALATFFSVDKWHSFWGFFGDPSRGLMSVIALVIAYYVIVSHYNLKRFVAMLWALAGANFLIVLWAVLQFMAVRIAAQSWGAYVPASMMGSLSSLGIFLGMMLPILVTLILHLKSENSRVAGKLSLAALAFLFITLLLNIFALLVLYSFVSWSGVLIGVSVFLIFILARIVRPANNWIWVPMAMFVSILAILMIGSNSISRVSLPVEISAAYSLSLDVAKESLKNSLLVGSGPATYGHAFSSFHPKEFNLESLYNLRFYQGTGLFFEAISTVGLLGTIAFLLLVLTFVGSGVYMLSINKSRNKLYSLGIFSAAIILVSNAFAGKIEGPILLVGLAVIALAMATLLTESESHERTLSLSLKASPQYALALAFVFMVVSAGVVFLFVFVGKAFIADLKAGSAVREKAVSETGSITKMAGAINWYNHEGRYFTRLGQEYLVLANNEALKDEKERNVNLIQNYLQSSIALSKQGRDMMPKDALAQETLAQSYENAGFYVPDSLTLSQEAYQKGLELEPHNAVYLMKIGQIKIAEGSAKNSEQDLKAGAGEAKEWFSKAINEKSNFAVAYYQLSFADEITGDKDGAIDAMEKALKYDNSNVSYVLNLARLHQTKGTEDDKKIAEILYKKVIEANDKDVNAHFSLGMLYEKMKNSAGATAEYKKLLELLPTSDKETRTQIQKMIDNVARGIENTPENIKSDAVVAPVVVPQESVAQDSLPLIQSGQ
ncbi:MAG: hypothetical protein HGA36_02835 [Candidatus Moranbacteria bacterium]|nr:hypothetical protein [Candidatus Moranbacteria bacterium]